nr:MAG TPA: hypothetical protein [Caudoviricetes sp.]
MACQVFRQPQHTCGCTGYLGMHQRAFRRHRAQRPKWQAVAAAGIPLREDNGERRHSRHRLARRFRPVQTASTTP